MLGKSASHRRRGAMICTLRANFAISDNKLPVSIRPTKLITHLLCLPIVS